MTYKLDDIPDDLDRALRERAAAEHKSLNATIIDVLSRGLGVQAFPPAEPSEDPDLSDVAGTWEEDPEFDAILEEQNRIDPEMWK
jgi:hypothetical protein